ncbi:hypothetical protein HF668_14205 [Acidithiobacillus ferridurans]|uniref:hypothetical protein n=1 Tax=Acidithiobacillus ferridurans TaxID=1232575 RepID=UPI001C07E305|nr:hypothetical protein [Acidithiobacillus ferridurans]MBU2806266.1 hypothetical protein [Acidithiobacillus ferridurans]
MNVKRKRRKQSQEVIEKRFIDKDWKVRSELAGRRDWSPTLEQFKRGLTDENHLVRETWLYREDLPLTQELIEIGLTDEWKDDRVKSTEIYFNLLDEFRATPTLEQIVRGLADEEERMRYMWKERERKWIEQGGTATPEQIERGLTDACDRVRSIWLSIARRQLCMTLCDDDTSTFLSI